MGICVLQLGEEAQLRPAHSVSPGSGKWVVGGVAVQERKEEMPGTGARVRNTHLFINRCLFDDHIVPGTMLGSGILP